jgi:hypothetical protein
LLRESFLAKREISLHEKELHFVTPESSTPWKIPHDCPTAWARKDGKGYYTLGALWFWLSNRELKQPEYLRSASSTGLPIVQFQDRQEVIDYFTGLITTTECIDERVRGETLIKKSHLKSGRVAHGAQVQEQMIRKREAKAEEKKERRERKVADFLIENERKITGKTNCL